MSLDLLSNEDSEMLLDPSSIYIPNGVTSVRRVTDLNDDTSTLSKVGAPTSPFQSSLEKLHVRLNMFDTDGRGNGYMHYSSGAENIMNIGKPRRINTEVAPIAPDSLWLHDPEDSLDNIELVNNDAALSAARDRKREDVRAKIAEELMSMASPPISPKQSKKKGSSQSATRQRGSGNTNTRNLSLDMDSLYLDAKEKEKRLAMCIKEYYEQYYPESHTREALHHLGTFIYGSSIRKVLSNWNLFESRFQYSSHAKTITLKNKSTGLNYAVHHKALPLSTMIGILCSQKVRVNFNELEIIFDHFKIPRDELFRSRSMAAIKVLIAHTANHHIEHDDLLDEELISLVRAGAMAASIAAGRDRVIDKEIGERLITIEEFREVIFAGEVEQRKKQEELVAAAKELMLLEHMLEKKKKQDMSERAEKRKKKASADYAAYLREIQFSKGIMTLSRINAMKNVIENAKNLNAEMSAVGVVKFPPEVTELLGIPCFPLHKRDELKEDLRMHNNRIHNAAVGNEKNKSLLVSLNKKPAAEGDASFRTAPSAVKSAAGMGYSGEFRLHLEGPPPVLETLKLAVSYGRGLSGLSYRDVVEMLQAYASTRIQGAYRSFTKRWRFRRARNLWKRVFGSIKLHHFSAWSTYSRYRFDLRYFCWRKVIAWRRYTVRAIIRRSFFKACFWPFYVWHRYANRCGMAREKTRFLVTRVVPTYQKLQVFHAWRKETTFTRTIREKALANHRSLILRGAQKVLTYMHQWARQKKILRRSWFKEGLMKLKKNIFKCKNIPFQIWRAYVYYKKESRRRIRDQAASFRNLMMPNLKCRAAPNRTAFRNKLRAAALKVEKEARKLRKKLEKEQQELMQKAFAEREAVKKKIEELVEEKEKKKSHHGHHGPKSPKNSPTRPAAGAVVFGGDSGADAKEDKRKIPEVAKVAQVELVEEPFEWYNYEDPYDFDSDDEEDLDVPAPVLALYQTKVNQLKYPQEIDFLQWSVSSLLEEIQYIQEEFKLAESWALLEYSARYHRLARRVLQNMHYYAIISRNGRESIRKYHLKLKRMTFTSLSVWVHRDSSADNSNALVQIDFSDQTEAERLSNVVRNARLAKLVRRREATAEVKALGRFHNEIEETVNPHSGIRKTLNNAMRIAAALQVPSRDKTSPTRTIEISQEDRSVSRNSPELVKSPSVLELVKSPSLLETDERGDAEDGLVIDTSASNDTTHVEQDSPVKEMSYAELEVLQKMERTLSSGVPTLRKASAKDVRRISSVDFDGRPASSPVVRAATADGITARPSNSSVKKLRSMTAGHDGHASHEGQIGKRKKTVVRTKADIELENLMKRRADYKMPDILSWDQADRGLEKGHAEAMMNLCLHYKSAASKACDEADRVTQESNAMKTLEKGLLDEIIKEEDVATAVAIKNENKYASDFKIHAADNMLIVLVRIYKEVVLQIMKAEAKKYFRALRGPMAERRSILLCNRKKMVNWIRLCKRMSSLYNNIDKYYVRRRQWIIFNRWLKLTEKESLTASPGLVDGVMRICELHPGFNDSLSAKGFIAVVYANSSRLQKEAADFIALFFRWQMYWSTRKVFGMLKAKATLLHKLRLMKRVFYALRFNMNTEETYEARVRDCGFPIRRALADLDQITKRFLAIRSRGLSSIIGYYNRKFIAQQQKDARNGPSFKRFLREFKSDVAYRLTTEQRVLNESFAARGVQQFKDVLATEAKIPNAMTRLDGKSFCDPTVDECEFGTEIPGGFRLTRILLNFQDGAGIVGWQLVWSADTCAEIESPKRGLWSGAAMKEQELQIPLTDFLFGIEYLYEGSTIMGLRLKLFFGGWTKWVGKRTSMSTLSLYICADHALKEDFELEYEPAGEDEKLNPAYPRSFIIGFSGLENLQNMTTNLSIVVRKVVSQHIFSYHWVQDELNRKAEALREIELLAAEDATTLDVDDDDSSEREDCEATEGEDTFGEFNTTLCDELTEGPSKSSRSSRQSKVFGNQKELQFRKRQASKAAMMGRKNSNYVNPKLIASWAKATGTDVIDDLSSEGSIATDKDALLPAEVEFFAVCRMRNTEIRALECRAEAFARRLWTKKVYRDDPQLAIFTQLAIVTGLTKWMFNSLCRRLCNIKRTEQQGTELLNQSLVFSNKFENAKRKVFQLNSKAAELENNIDAQPWAANAAFKLLSPTERIERKAYLNEIKRFKEQAKEEEAHMISMQELSVSAEAKGRKLLPRLQLSQYVCNFYKVKVAASRHMQSLLKRMDMNTIKASLNGAVNDAAGLTKVQMDIIRTSLLKKGSAEKQLRRLDDVQDEVKEIAAHTVLEKESRSLNRTTYRRAAEKVPSAAVRGTTSCSDLIGASGFKSARPRQTKMDGASYAYKPLPRPSTGGTVRVGTPAAGNRKSTGDISLSDSVSLPKINPRTGQVR